MPKRPLCQPRNSRTSARPGHKESIRGRERELGPPFAFARRAQSEIFPFPLFYALPTLFSMGCDSVQSIVREQKRERKGEMEGCAASLKKWEWRVFSFPLHSHILQGKPPFMRMFFFADVVTDWLCVRKIKKERDIFPSRAILRKRVNRALSI